MINEINKKIQTGLDIGGTFFNSIHENGPMLVNFNYDELRILAPQYFIDILQQDIMRRCGAPSLDPDGYFKFMGIKMLPSPFEKIIIYHVQYPLYKREEMYYEFDLSIFIS